MGLCDFAFQIKTNAAKAKSQLEREQVSALTHASSAASITMSPPTPPSRWESRRNRVKDAWRLAAPNMHSGGLTIASAAQDYGYEYTRARARTLTRTGWRRRGLSRPPGVMR
jgi:hypothetical protein